MTHLSVLTEKLRKKAKKILDKKFFHILLKKLKFSIDNLKIIIYKFFCCRHSSVGRATDL